MSALLKFEFRKLRQARVLYICAGILVILILIFAGTNKLTELAVQSVTESYMEEPQGDLNDSFSASMGLLSNNNGATGFLNAMTNIYIIVVFAAFAAVFICGDYGNGTIKNILTKGYSRSEVFFAKYIVCLVVCFIYAAIAYLTGFLCGTLMWRIGDSWSPKFLLLVLIQLIAVAAFNAFFNFLAALFKRVGAVLALSIAIPIILPLILSIADLIINGKIAISDYWLSGAIGLAASPSASAGDMATSVICSFIYGVVFTIVGWILAKKREV